uniref:Anaphase-promoting complex subunit 13 n=1 Tax=Tetranychus urticae TaxID=32264 RepID=T1JVU1_TETUR
MDSQYYRPGRSNLLIDKKWRRSVKKLPFEDITVPIRELPDSESDNENCFKTIKDQENKWTDLALNRINDNHQSSYLPSNRF